MTYQDFLSRLRGTPRDWWISSEGVIRRGETNACQCPISAIENRHVADYANVASRAGLSLNLTASIAEAADRRAPYSARVRADLLKACGLD